MPPPPALTRKAEGFDNGGHAPRCRLDATALVVGGRRPCDAAKHDAFGSVGRRGGAVRPLVFDGGGLRLGCRLRCCCCSGVGGCLCALVGCCCCCSGVHGLQGAAATNGRRRRRQVVAERRRHAHPSTHRLIGSLTPLLRYTTRFEASPGPAAEQARQVGPAGPPAAPAPLQRSGMSDRGPFKFGRGACRRLEPSQSRNLTSRRLCSKVAAALRSIVIFCVSRNNICMRDEVNWQLRVVNAKRRFPALDTAFAVYTQV